MIKVNYLCYYIHPSYLTTHILLLLDNLDPKVYIVEKLSRKLAENDKRGKWQ